VNNDDGSTEVYCSETDEGKAFTKQLDVYYSTKEGSTNIISYDWCQCGGLGAGAIAGIVIGCVAGVVLIIAIIACCRRKVNSE
jgi:hypothetical protein